MSWSLEVVSAGKWSPVRFNLSLSRWLQFESKWRQENDEWLCEDMSLCLCSFVRPTHKSEHTNWNHTLRLKKWQFAKVRFSTAVIPLPHPGVDKGWKGCWFDWSEDQLTKHTRVKRFHTPSDLTLCTSFDVETTLRLVYWCNQAVYQPHGLRSLQKHKVVCR